jgi:voltage-gated potassium channel
MLLEGRGAWDAFYTTVLELTTVESPGHLTRGGQAFTVVLLLGGIGAMLYTFTLLATVVVEGGLPKRLRQRRNERMLERITDHFIICGYGRVGAIVGRQFRRQQVPYVVVERDPARVEQAIEDGAVGVEADASREEVLTRVGIERARGLVAAVGTDAENVYAVLTARVMRPDIFIVGRATTEDAVTKLKRAGADRVILPYQTGAMQIAQTALRPAVVDFFDLAMSADNLELAIEEVAIAPRSVFASQSILEANLRQRYGVIVIGIQHNHQGEKKLAFNPDPETTMHAGDRLVVLGRPDALKRLEVDAAGASH